MMARGALLLSLLCGCHCPDRPLDHGKATDRKKPPDLTGGAIGRKPDATPRDKVLPVRFTAINASGETVYVDWTRRKRAFSCSVWRAGKWQDCSFYPPSCTRDCSAKNKGKDCRIFCEPPRFAARALRSRERIDATWSGDLYERVTGHCSKGVCLKSVKPRGWYRASLCVQHKNPCPTYPLRRGVMKAVTLSGEKTCFSKEFDVPGEGHVVVTIDR